jgi:hypothetical protein
MSRSTENTGFRCEHCQQMVQPVTNGSYRNHCPFCLHSKHVDIMPGDRRNPGCQGRNKKSTESRLSLSLLSRLNCPPEFFKHHTAS